MKVIGFCGAGGTGKSTTADYIGCNAPSPVNGLRRHFYGPKAKYDEFTSVEDIFRWQYGLVYGQVALEEYVKLENEGTDNYVPVERSTIDYAAYMLSQCDRFQKEEAHFKEIEEYTKWCTDYANKNYDILVYFPPGVFEPRDAEGSNKERNKKSIYKTDRYIKSLLKFVKIPILKLQSATVERRAEEIVDFCDKH